MTYTNPQLHIGSAYYPEHWPEDRWIEDIRLMKAAGFTVARVGEFAWSTFEPAEGEFRFGWLDRAIDLLAKNDLVTVMSTPTAAPPAWLTQQYPATLAVNADGTRREHGQRCHYCVNSPEYQAHTRRIVAALGAQFGSNPHIIGWQFDNEYNTICYCPTCKAKFHQYLQDQFQTLDSLNQKWSTAYWSQTYSAWDQIPIPKEGHNPGLRLAFQQFVTASYRRFQRLQLDELKPHLREGVWTTHNFMKWFPNYDHYELSADLDVASWDWYVGSGHNDFTTSGAAHDLVRGFKRQNFWLMETQPGHVNWSPLNNQVNKGEARAMAWHAVGHGADAVLYWQWRSALNGQEQYHGTLVDQSGQPRPFYEEAAQLGREFAQVSDLLANSQIQAKVALLHDYNSRWSLDWQRHHKDFDYVKHLEHYYRPLANLGIPTDILAADQPLERSYRLVIVPALVILTPKRVQNLLEYADKGGNLIITARTGMKDEFNALLPARQPGGLAELCGVEVEEYYALDQKVPVKGNWFSGYAHKWAERLKIIGENTLRVAFYGRSNGWLDDQAAITINPTRMARSMVYYVGAYLDDAAQHELLAYILKNRGIRTPLETPRGVELCQRVRPDNERVYILINHENRAKKVTIPWTAREHLSGNVGAGDLTLAPYGVAVLTREES